MTIFLSGICISALPASATTSIPSQAWNRDINATGYIDGAPVGGFGAGTLTWDLAGDFYLGRLNIAAAPTTTTSVPYATDSNAHFYMYQKLSGQTAVFKMLDAATLGTGEATYYSLFPKSWVDYYGTIFPLDTKVTQFSPIIPGDYVRSSYPEGIYEWDVTNSQGVSCDFAVMLTFDNIFGGTNAAVTTSGSNVGLVLTRNNGNATTSAQGEFTLATQSSAGVSVTYESAASVATLQTAFSAAGFLNNTVGTNTIGGIAFKVTLAPGQSVKIPIVLDWDIPIARPGTGASWWREYTRTYGRTGLQSATIAFDALGNYATWESSIDSWQNGILAGSYPDWMKQMLFNELYYYFTGGTMWEAGQVGSTSFDAGPDMFSSLESYIYDFYGTSDVRFYGSWPLALMWPNIDKQEVEQFCDSVTLTGSQPMPRPPAIGTCAHDFGDVNSIFTAWNAYTYRNSTLWRDLNSKLVLMVYRYWELGGKTDTTFLNYCWPAVQAAMAYVHGQCDANGLPNISATDANSGADCTYDDMGLNGDTAYCGSLFLAACEAAQSMAVSEGNSALANTYQGWLTVGQTGFAALWNGSYYNIDNGATDTAQNRIMSDQLAGEWYAKALGLPGIVSDANANSAWQAVHDNNWAKFDTGSHGVVNVMTVAGAIDTSWPQSQEVWVGVGWGAVAGMVQQGMSTQATDVGYSLYNSIWNLGQLWFRTPEAWQTGLSNVRAPYYMRANGIWAVKHAYDITPPPCGAQTCSPTPTFTATATPIPPSACASPVRRVNCAGGAYTAGGITWAADQAYTSGGWGYVSGTAATSITNAISGTSYPGLYQTERYGNPVEYKFTVPNGAYQIILRFVEQHWNSAGSRVFNVAINGNTVISNLDIYAQVGKYTALNYTFVIPVTSGLIDIVETPSVDNAEITGIDILDNSVQCSPTPTPTGQFTATSTPTFTPSRTMTSSPTTTPTFSPTLTATSTVTNTATLTLTRTPTATPSMTPTQTGTSSATSTSTSTITSTPSPTSTSTVTSTYTLTPILTFTPTSTPTRTPTMTVTSTPSLTASFTVTGTPTLSPTGTPAASLTQTPTSSATSTPSSTVTATSSKTPTASPTASATLTATSTASHTPTYSPTPTPTSSVSPTPTSTLTFSATATSTLSPTGTLSPSLTPTITNTPALTATFSATATVTSTHTSTVTFTPTLTATHTLTASPTLTVTPTVTKTFSPTDTPMFTASFTATPSTVVIGPVYPNPIFENGPVKVEVQLPGTASVKWSVFTTAFRKITGGTALLTNSGIIQWDLTDASEKPVASGLYYLRVEAQTGSGTVPKILKVLVIR